MAELTQTEIEAIIPSIDAHLAVLIAAHERMVDYSAGTKSFNNSQRFNGLMKMREYYLLNMIGKHYQSKYFMYYNLRK